MRDAIQVAHRQLACRLKIKAGDGCVKMMVKNVGTGQVVQQRFQQGVDETAMRDHCHPLVGANPAGQLAQLTGHSDSPALAGGPILVAAVPPAGFGNLGRQNVTGKFGQNFGASFAGVTDQTALLTVIQVDAAMLVQINPDFRGQPKPEP